MRGWQIAIAIFAGFFVFAGILAAIGGSVEEPVQTETKQESVATESAEEIEDFTVEPKREGKPVTEIYGELELGMSEEQVWEIAGEPDITSQADVEGFGNMLELIYSDGHSLDNVTIMLEDGTVKMIVLGEFDGDRIDVKSKM